MCHRGTEPLPRSAGWGASSVVAGFCATGGLPLLSGVGGRPSKCGRVSPFEMIEESDHVCGRPMSVTNWDPLLGTDWDMRFTHEFEQQYWADLQAFVKKERTRYNVYPPRDDVFTAFRLTPYAETKVVILGQDPYHGPGQAHGLCFSVRRGCPVPPSLRNIDRELRDDLGVQIPDHGSLEPWARRGVLLLNATLTVGEGVAGSHSHKGADEGAETDSGLFATRMDARNPGPSRWLWPGLRGRRRARAEGRLGPLAHLSRRRLA